MIHSIVYGAALWLFMATTAMTIAAIIMPEWISWDTQIPNTKQIHYSYGLHQRCSSIDQDCYPFPRWEECHGDERRFCSLWRTTSFLMSLAVVAELATFAAFAVLILGGKQRREKGWRILTVFILLSAGLQAASMAIVTDLFEHDERFIPGWKLDKCFILCTVSWALQAIVMIGIWIAVLVLPEEGGYELIPDRERTE